MMKFKQKQKAQQRKSTNGLINEMKISENKWGDDAYETIRQT